MAKKIGQDAMTVFSAFEFRGEKLPQLVLDKIAKNIMQQDRDDHREGSGCEFFQTMTTLQDNEWSERVNLGSHMVFFSAAVVEVDGEIGISITNQERFLAKATSVYPCINANCSIYNLQRQLLGTAETSHLQIAGPVSTINSRLLHFATPYDRINDPTLTTRQQFYRPQDDTACFFDPHALTAWDLVYDE